MRRDPRAYLADIRDAGGLIAGFIAGLDLERYRSDALVRSGTERQLEIVGEALGRLSRTDPILADRIPDIASIIGFRNVLAHGYDIVRDEVVWRTVTEDVPGLIVVVEHLLAELDEEQDWRPGSI